jgi:HAD superfamily hydrolase (TIGR01509 family)
LKAVIWDFDGTLFDTYPGMLRALMATLKDYGVQKDADQLLVAIKRDSMKKVFDDVALEYQLDRSAIQKKYNEYEIVLNAEPKAYPGAATAIRAVQERGDMNLLWTHRDQKAWRLLKRDGLDDAFAGGTTIDMHFKRKPDPESINYLLAKFGLNPQQTLVVGDRRLDALAAIAAGCHSLYLDVDGLHDAPQAEFTAPDLRSALPIIVDFLED